MCGDDYLIYYLLKSISESVFSHDQETYDNTDKYAINRDESIWYGCLAVLSCYYHNIVLKYSL